MKVPANLDHYVPGRVRDSRSTSQNIVQGHFSGSSTTKSSSCDAGGAVKCSPAKVHTGVIESFFRSGA